MRFHSPRVPEWNAIALFVLISRFVLWKTDFIATLLNIKSLPESPPAGLRDRIDAATLDRTRSYLVTNARFHIVESVVSLGLFLGFWMLGGFGWIDRIAWSWGRSPVSAGLVFFALMFLAVLLSGLPFQVWRTFVIEQRFGFNRTTPRTFIVDILKSLLLAALLGGPLAAAVLAIFQHVAHAWLWAWLVVTAFQLALTYVAPTWIMPLFNKFTPMPEGELRRRIQQLGGTCGFPLADVFVMDGSKRSSKANAFFTGFGKNKKIALFDTLIEAHSTDELLAVLAHEIGHFKRGHIRQRLAVGMLQTAAVFFLLGWALNPGGWLAPQWTLAFGLPFSLHAGMVIFFILFEPIGRLLGIASHAWSRKHEFEADAYAAHAMGGGEALSTALKKLSTDQLAHPTPHAMRVWLDYSHPPLLQRLAALRKLAGHESPKSASLP